MERGIQTQWLEEMIMKQKKKPTLVVLEKYAAALGKCIELRLSDEE